MTVTVKDLKKQLVNLPDDLEVRLYVMGTNGWQHQVPKFRKQNKYIIEIPTDRGWQYETVHAPILEIS